MAQKFYLTGTNIYSKNLNNKIMELREFGYKVTHRWIKTKNPQKASVGVTKMIKNIQTADRIILFLDTRDIGDTLSSYTEAFKDISCALGANKDVIIIYNGPETLELVEEIKKTTPLLQHPAISFIESWQTFLTELILDT